jgi:hypothetical protein
MDPFFHIRMVLSIIMSLSIAHLLKGAVKIVEHPTKNRPYPIHLLWALYIFIMLIHFWWWEIHLSIIKDWTFFKYFFVVAYIIMYYVLCTLLFPDDMSEYGSFENYFYSRKNWFFGLLALTFVIDIFDTLLKGKDYTHRLMWEYPVRNTLHFVLCFVAMKASNRKFHFVLVILFIVYELSWILRLYNRANAL